MALTKDDAIEIIKPFWDKIDKSIQVGVENYFQCAPLDILEHTPTAKANVIYCKIKTQVKKMFANDNRVNVVERRNDFYIVIENCLLIKFKKLSQTLKVGNIPTEWVKEYQAQGKLDIFPSARINLYAGYVLDGLGRKIDKVYLTCPSENGNNWVVQLNKDEYTETLIELPIEAHVTQTTKRVRARLRNEGAKDGTTDNKL